MDDDLSTTTERAQTQRGTARPALRRCTDLPVTEFADRVWGRRAAVARFGPGAFEDLLTLAGIDDLVSRRGLRTPFLRVARSGRTLGTDRFTRAGGVGAGVGDQVDDAALTRLFADGHTLVLQGLHRTHPPLIDLAQQLSADLGHPAQVNAYVTPASSQGFEVHYDVHDVFVLQLSGRKRWRIHDPVLAHPLRDQPWTERRAAVRAAAATEPALDVVLAPGDSLYLPAGFLHAAEALGDVSAHLTIGVHTWNRMHLVEQALAGFGEHEELRVPLPLGVDVRDPESLRAELAATLEAAARALRGTGPEEVAARLSGDADRAVRAEPVAPLAQDALVRNLDADTPVRWRRHLPTRLVPAGDVLRVRTAEGTVEVPAPAEAAVRALVDGVVIPAGQVGLDSARHLVRAALLVAG